MMSNSSSSNSSSKSRVLSEIECRNLLQRATQFSHGGGLTSISIDSGWTGALRFGRNRFSSSGDIRNNTLTLQRTIRGARGLVEVNQVDDGPLEAAIRRAERMAEIKPEGFAGYDFAEVHFQALPTPPLSVNEQRLNSGTRDSALNALIQTPEKMPQPKIFFENTFNLDSGDRALALAPLVASIKDAGMWAAGYMQVAGTGRAVMSSFGRSMYYPWTTAQYSVTVRDPDGTGSGWSGVDWSEWARIDGKKLTMIALDKCLRSRNPVRLEPGRYTAILEPQAVCDFCQVLFSPATLSYANAYAGYGPYSNGRQKRPKLQEKIFDERITVSTDPEDADLGFVPFSQSGDVYHAVTWTERGILKNLAYSRSDAIKAFGKNEGQPASGAFRMSGEETSLEEMISTTKRGIYVTRFSDVAVLDPNSVLLMGYTRDGLWLIENGRISKAIKNFRFTDSPMFVLNQVDAIGKPQRVFNPGAPVIVPPLKVRDFNFSALTDAV